MKYTRALSLVAAFAACAAVSAQTTAFFSSEDAEAYVSALAPMVEGGELADASFAARALALLGKRGGVKKAGCKALKAALKKASNVADLAAAASGVGALGCKLKVPAEGQALVDGAVAGSLDEVAAAAEAAAELGLTLDVTAVADRVLALMDEDGTWRQSEDDVDGSAENTAVALRALGAASKVEGGAEAVADAAAAASEVVAALLSDAEASAGGAAKLELDAPSPLRATAGVMIGLGALSESKVAVQDMDVDQVHALAEAVLAHRAEGTQSSEAAFLVVAALKAAESSLSEDAPLAVALERTHFAEGATGEQGKLRVAVRSLMGGSVKGASVALEAAVAGEEVFVSDVDMPANGKVFETDFLERDPKPTAGTYVLSLRVDAGGRATSARRQVQVSTEATLKNVRVAIKGGKAEEEEVKASYPKPVAEALSADSSQTLEVAFAVVSRGAGTPLRPHQVFLRLTHVESGVHTYVVARRRGSKGDYVCSVDLGDDSNNLERRSGEYELHLLVGDRFMRQGVVYKLADASFSLPDPKHVQEVPLYHRPLLHDSDTTLKALPEITHQFREPEALPPQILSLVFTAASVAPSILFVLGLLVLGANLNGFPGGLGFIWALGFHGGLAAILALFVVYWLRLDMFTTLGGALLLGALTAIFGHRSLRATAAKEARAKAAKAAQ
mmetsp:Transcript_12246/g.39183  ORF Transcript_12246/g.39183 Transcript_12246/m.39183 type:complete len:675 (-) Transcript_12246:37-2061(-)